MNTKFITSAQFLRAQNLCTTALTALILATSFEVGIQPSVAGTIRHDRDDWLYRNLADNFPSVGYLAAENAYQSWGCSGTLIGSHYVLTAAHCVEKPIGGFMEYGMFNIAGSAYAISAYYAHMGWFDSGRNLGLGVDLAILGLNRSVWNVNPAILYSGRDEDLKLGTYVGYGRTGTGADGAYLDDDSKRAGQNTISVGSNLGEADQLIEYRLLERHLGETDQLLVSDFDNPRYGSSNEPLSLAKDLEYQLAPGDSGGGLFIDGRLAGIHSFVSSNDGNTDSDYGDFSFSVRVSSYIEWIHAAANAVSQEFGVPSSLVATSPGVTSDGVGWNRQADVPLSEKYNQFDYTVLARLLTDEQFQRYSSEAAQDDELSVSTPEPGGLMGLMSIMFMALAGRILDKQGRKS